MHDIAAIAAAEAGTEEDIFQDEEHNLGLIASVIIIGAEISHQAHIDNRHENQLLDPFSTPT